MRLRQLNVQRMLGFTLRGFTLEQLHEGINCIWGPNGSGKTTACLAIRRLLWPHDPSVKDLLPQLSSIWEHDAQEGEIIVAGREYRVGKDLPIAEIQKFSPHLYTITIDDLFVSTDHEFASAIAKEVRGGYDLNTLREELILTKNFGDKEVKQFRNQKDLLYQEISRQQEIYQKESTLAALEEQIGLAASAEKKLIFLQTALHYHARLMECEEIGKKITAFPAGIEKMRTEDRKHLETLQQSKRTLESELALLPTPAAAIPTDLNLAQGLIQEIRLLDKEIELCTKAHIEAREQRLFYCRDLQLEPEKLAAINLIQLDRLLPGVKKLHESSLRSMEIKAKLTLVEEQKSSAFFLVSACLGLLVGTIAFFYMPWILAIAITLAPAAYTGLLWQKKRQECNELLRGLHVATDELQHLRTELDGYLETMGLTHIPDYSLLGNFLQQIKIAQGYWITEKQKEALLIPLLEQREKIVNEVTRVLGKKFAYVVEMENELSLKRRQQHEQIQREKCLRELVLVGEQLNELFTRCGCQEEAEFLERYSRLSSYANAAMLRDKLEGSLAELQRQMQSAPEFISRSRESLEQEKTVLEERAATLRSLIEKKAGIEKEIEKAQHGRDLEEKRIACISAEQNLEQKKIETHHRLLGLFLLEEIEESFRKETRPQALRNADSYFQRFTKSAYAIHGVDEKNKEASFVAYDCALSSIKPLSELSCGTRLQLLLAIRLGFIQAMEKEGMRLPLILDEVASHADDERWRAIAGVLLEEAALGRQILYFTCQRWGVEAWKGCSEQISFHNLAEARHHLPFSISVVPSVQMPLENETIYAYAQRTGLPGLDFSLPASAQNISHFVKTSEELYLLLYAGITTLGQVQKMHESQCLAPFLTQAAARRALAKGILLERFFHQYRIGRPQIVERHDLEAAWQEGCVSDKFLPVLCDLVEEEKGKGDRILAALHAKKIKGYRAEKIEELRDFFLKRAKLDLRTPYGADELRMIFWESYREHADALLQKEAAEFLFHLLAVSLEGIET